LSFPEAAAAPREHVQMTWRVESDILTERSYQQSAAIEDRKGLYELLISQGSQKLKPKTFRVFSTG
jgi:hypothetical protein